MIFVSAYFSQKLEVYVHTQILGGRYQEIMFAYRSNNTAF